MPSKLPLLAAVAVGLGACVSAAPEIAAPPAAPAPLPAPPPAADPAPAPWSAAMLPRPSVPAVYLEQWAGAENRATCAPLAPAGLGQIRGAVPRAANFAGGWAVAYDLPTLPSAFGVAGAGVRATDPSFDAWPFNRQWADGSTVGYGPEGGTGPNQLAYLRVQGQGCLYNVWSRLGREHLELLLDQLRLVDTRGP